jgi:hypothetical protein
MSGYQGHRSWNAWNVALWIGSDEGLYRLALECKASSRDLRRAAALFMRELAHPRTPDGAVFNITSVAEALRGLE